MAVRFCRFVSRQHPLLIALICGCCLLAVALRGIGAQVDGAAIYHDNCAVCHGDNGDGASQAKAGLTPPPRDFTSPESAIYLIPERMYTSITEGVEGTAMIPWKTRLSEEEIGAVIDHIRTSFMPSVATEDASRGRRIFAEYCSVCHGDAGQGAMWAMSGLAPPPANFTAPAVQQRLDRQRMIQSVTYGVAETAMTAWRSRLNPSDVESVVDYIQEAFMGRKLEMNAEIEPEIDMAAALPDGLVGNRDRGLGLFVANCATCHGVAGDGRGPRAYFINPKPRNFVHPASKATLNRPVLYSAIAKGRLLSEMPAWEKVFTPQEIADVTEYVYEAFIAGSRRR